ncbi:MAG TPA: isoprenylcysteine carboxylmethyltransferase family protein [Terracidiphilus sp.]|nr:isoprenylcysteine carboxylmethyltransferase family protein [Terracidiphilus sp.]
MRATAFEFRIRSVIHAVIIVLGFLAPWDRWLHLDSAGPNAHVWGTLAAHLAMIRPGAVSIATAFNLLLGLATACALVSAALRTWGTAYLGASVVHSSAMHGDAVVAAGPYRYLRNPLYVGIFVHSFALALLMPPSGAVFCVVAIGLFQLRLIGGEEAFLATRLGEPYRAYCARVPRLFPALRPRVAASATRPAWAMAFLGEIYTWGVFGVFVALGYRYNAFLLMQGVLITYGVSLIVRALVTKPGSLAAVRAE